MITLNATIREDLGKKSKKLRGQGKIPAVLYGRKVSSTPITLDYRNFEKIYKEAGESTLISLELDEASAKTRNVPSENVVLIRDVVMNPISRLYTHIDFYQVPMDEEIDIEIPLEFINESPAAKEEGGVLVRNVYKIEVSALPKDLPHEIIVDLSRLKKIDDVIMVKDLEIPQGVTANAEEDMIVATVTMPEEEVIEEVTEAPALEEIKTEAEEKREEEEKEAAEEQETSQ